MDELSNKNEQPCTIPAIVGRFIMTPKEKVDKLCFRFNAETVMQQPYEHEVHMKKAKQSTIICIEEILKAREAGTTGVVFDKEYWEEALEIANAL